MGGGRKEGVWFLWGVVWHRLGKWGSCQKQTVRGKTHSNVDCSSAHVSKLRGDHVTLLQILQILFVVGREEGKDTDMMALLPTHSLGEQHVSGGVPALCLLSSAQPRSLGSAWMRSTWCVFSCLGWVMLQLRCLFSHSQAGVYSKICHSEVHQNTRTALLGQGDAQFTPAVAAEDPRKLTRTVSLCQPSPVGPKQSHILPLKTKVLVSFIYLYSCPPQIGHLQNHSWKVPQRSSSPTPDCSRESSQSCGSQPFLHQDFLFKYSNLLGPPLVPF